MKDCMLKEVIDTYGENDAKEVLEIFHFFLKKMEYTQRKRNDAAQAVEYLESEYGIKPKYGFNPMKGGTK
jgi:hypothetical protein